MEVKLLIDILEHLEYTKLDHDHNELLLYKLLSIE